MENISEKISGVEQKVEKPVHKKKAKKNKLELFFMSLFYFSLLSLFIFVFVFMRYGVSLPDYNQLSEYTPPVTSRFYTGDGSLLTEYATEQRIYVPLNDIPPNLANAFISAEDKNFWTHSGIDLLGIVRATLTNIKYKLFGNSGRMVGASTIAQQVAKNFFLSSEQSFSRKIKEIILALKMERAFSKRHILTLYFNQIFLGFRSYGVAAAALNYFNKSLDELTLAESAFLASLPKAPNNYNPLLYKERAIARRNWVLDRMAIDGYISKEDAEFAQQDDIEVSESFMSKNQKYSLYFSEDVRKQLSSVYGEDQLYGGGLAVRTTLNPEYQRIATNVVRKALVNFDVSRGWRGAETNVNLDDDALMEDANLLKQLAGGKKELWQILLSKTPMISGLEDAGWRKAIVLDVNSGGAEIGLSDGSRGVINLATAGFKRLFAGNNATVALNSLDKAIKRGDVIFVDKISVDGAGSVSYALKQVPELNGGMVVLDPHTGRVLAMVGGFSYSRSKFNRATQAFRQPGSTIKPFVYLTAMEQGYTPSSIILDAPIVMEKEDGELWRPENYDNEFVGEITVRRALEQSKNNPTIRIAKDSGIRNFIKNATKFGVYKKVDSPNLSMALGSGDTTLLDITSGFAKIINGGKDITPFIVARVQDRNGATIYKSDMRECEDCSGIMWDESLLPPEIKDDREQLSDPISLYQVVNMMQGVVERGSGWMARIDGKTIGGKTGTSNDQKDVWFIGGTPDLVAGVFFGYDKPKSLGGSAMGGSFAAPVFREFMVEALKGKKDVPFRVPAGVSLVRVNRETGKPATVYDSNYNVVLEAFKEGTEPVRFSSSKSTTTSSSGSGNSKTDFRNNNLEMETNFDGIY